MKNNALVSVRSNCNFSLDYQTGKLHPQTEVIIITSAPKYSFNKNKTSLQKEQEVTEYRFVTDLSGINILIGELQNLVKNMNTFEQTSAAINQIVEASKK